MTVGIREENPFLAAAFQGIAYASGVAFSLRVRVQMHWDTVFEREQYVSCAVNTAVLRDDQSAGQFQRDFIVIIEDDTLNGFGLVVNGHDYVEKRSKRAFSENSSVIRTGNVVFDLKRLFKRDYCTLWVNTLLYMVIYFLAYKLVHTIEQKSPEINANLRKSQRFRP